LCAVADLCTAMEPKPKESPKAPPPKVSPEQKEPRPTERRRLKDGGRARIFSWIYAAIFGILIVNIFMMWRGADSNEVSYSTLLQQIEDGYVESLMIVNDKRIDGVYSDQAVEEGRVSVKSGRSGPLGGSSSEGRFRSTKTASHDLVAVLNAYNAAHPEHRVEFKVAHQESWFGGAMGWILGLCLLVALWVFLLRRMNPGSQVLNIGKNKAVLFDSLQGKVVTFDDVAGLVEAKEEVAEVVEFLQNPKKFTKLGGVLPKGVLLVGPPGTGKTLMGKAVAGEAGVPFFSLSGSDFVEMFVGVGAARVRDLFKQAKEKAPCIIFVDEVDAIGRSRGRNMMMGGNDERENTLNQLLVEMDGFNTDKGVIIMAATNRPDVLDSALLRPGRFDRQIMIDRPDRMERAEIFKVHTRVLVLHTDVNHEVLASQTPGFAGAEIANVCNEAALLAARQDKEAIAMVDFEKAIDRTIGGLEKKNKLIKPEEKRIVAYHEAGHAIAGWYLKHTDPVIKVSIVPRGLAALGYAQSLPDERYITTREAFLDQMTMMIGGRVAEEIVFGQLSTGAQNDLERITKTAYAMVIDFGMSDKVGHVSFNVMYGRKDMPVFDKPYSQRLAETIDEEVRVLIDEVRRRAFALLEAKREKLEELAQLLLDQEVLGPADLVHVLGERPYGEYVTVNGPPRVAAAENAHSASESPATVDGPIASEDPVAENGQAAAEEPAGGDGPVASEAAVTDGNGREAEASDLAAR